MAPLHVLRVFTEADGSHGNPLGVFIGGREVPTGRRQEIARDLGFAETVFVDDAEHGEIRIFTPAVELPFAGHPSVGSAWLLRELGHQPATLRAPAGDLGIRFEDGLTWIAARPEWAPPFEYVQLESPTAVESLSGAPEGLGFAYCWAWADEPAGRVRARAFVPEAGVPEDEATGSAALALCGRLGRPIEIRQGRGSALSARPRDDCLVEIGGRTVLDEVRQYQL